MTEKKGAPHTDQIHRINRIEGQVRGVKKMVEEERYCVDILTQIKAIKSALTSVETNIVEKHLGHCVNDAIQSNNETRASEIISEIKSLLRSASS